MTKREVWTNGPVHISSQQGLGVLGQLVTKVVSAEGQLSELRLLVGQFGVAFQE